MNNLKFAEALIGCPRPDSQFAKDLLGERRRSNDTARFVDLLEGGPERRLEQADNATFKEMLFRESAPSTKADEPLDALVRRVLERNPRGAKRKPRRQKEAKNVPGIYKPGELEEIVQRLKLERERSIGRKRESVQPRGAGRMIRLREVCTMETQQMCSCRNCVPENCR